MGKVFAYLFFAVFAAAGIAAFYFISFDMVFNSVKANSWEPVYAELQSYDLDTNRSSDSTTYKAMASYSYDYQGVRYTSNKVSFSNGYDNLGSYHQDMYQRLRRISRNDERLEIWVNPDKPSQAVIDRGVRWGSLVFGSIFLLIFGGVGFGGLYFSYVTRNDDKPIENSDPNKPWTVYRIWASPIRLSNAKIGARFWLGFALFWNVISLASVFAAFDEVMSGNHLALIVLLFPLIGIFLLWNWYKAHRSFKLTGLMPLELDPYPGSVGGQVGGTIRVSNQRLQSPKNLKIKLLCVYKYQQKSGKETKTKERIVWEQSMVPKSLMSVTGIELRFSFDVPDNLPVSDPPFDSSRNMWRVSFTGEAQDGVLIERQYDDIPVFDTAQKSSFRDQEAYAATSIATQAAAQKLVESVLDVEQSAHGYTLNYPMFSNWGGLAALVFGVIFIVVGWMIPQLVFNIVFPIIGGLVVIGGADAFFSALNVQISAHGITSQKSLFGFKLKEKFIPSYGLKGFFANESYSSSSGNKTIRYFNLEAHGIEGEKIVVAKKLKAQEEVDAAIKKFEALTQGY